MATLVWVDDWLPWEPSCDSLFGIFHVLVYSNINAVGVLPGTTLAHPPTCQKVLFEAPLILCSFATALEAQLMLYCVI